jgi:hypothetical protein
LAPCRDQISINNSWTLRHFTAIDIEAVGALETAMDLFVITYRLSNEKSFRTLYLDLRAKRWSARTVVRTLIASEFPSAKLPPMKFKDWSADEVLACFGIYGYECVYQYMPDFHGTTLQNGIVLRSAA